MHNIYKLKNKWAKGQYLSIGLDSDVEKIPNFLLKEAESESEAVLLFNKKIIDATFDLVCAYKINSAFYEKLGPKGLEVMEKTVRYIKEKDSDIFLIADAKRGDIGNTNEGYKYFVNDGIGDNNKSKSKKQLENRTENRTRETNKGEWSLGFDSLTIHPYLGLEANKTFLNEKDKFFFVLAKTSNEGSGEFQDLMTEGLPLYLRIVKNVKEKWNVNGNCGLVIGATYEEHLLKARSMGGEDIVFLIPGIGAQGGDLKATLENGLNKKNEGVIINMSRSVIFASREEDFAGKAREEAEKFNKEVKEILELKDKVLKETPSEKPSEKQRKKIKKIYEARMLEIFKEKKAVITDGHFVYQTGTHGSAYVSKDRLNPDPLVIDEVGKMLADLIKEKDIDTVVAPAVGGIVLGHIVAKYLSYFKDRAISSVFIEKAGKDETGKDTFKITRGYEKFLENKKVAVVEDTVNTGYSVKKVVETAKLAGASVEVVAVICNRGNVKKEDIDEKAELVSLTELNFEKYEKEDCPLCKEGIPINTDFGHYKK